MATDGRVQLATSLVTPIPHILTYRFTLQIPTIKSKDSNSGKNATRAAKPAMLIPTIYCAKDKRVRFEDQMADNQQTTRQKVNRRLEPRWCDIRKDHKGRNIVVAHRGPRHRNVKGSEGGGKGGTEDVKKGANGGSESGGAKDGAKKDEAKAEDGRNAGEGGNGVDDDGKKSHDLTPKEDEKLKSLKTGSKSWKDIAKEMGKPQGVLQQRWKAIKPNAGGGGRKGGDAGDEKKSVDDDKGNKNGDDKPAKAEKQAAKGKAKQEEAKRDNMPKGNGDGSQVDRAKMASKSGGEARFRTGEWVTLQEDDMFSFGELQLIAELIARHDADRWHVVASRFYDKTGRRVAAGDVRDKFMQAGVVG